MIMQPEYIFLSLKKENILYFQISRLNNISLKVLIVDVKGPLLTNCSGFFSKLPHLISKRRKELFNYNLLPPPPFLFDIITMLTAMLVLFNFLWNIFSPSSHIKTRFSIECVSVMSSSLFYICLNWPEAVLISALTWHLSFVDRWKCHNAVSDVITYWVRYSWPCQAE